MTKSKMLSGILLNPLDRLNKRMEEHKRRHLTCTDRHKKKFDAHIKCNLELKILLERKSKSGDNKTKKKRNTNPMSGVNKKKAKQEVLKNHANNSYFCNQPVNVQEFNPNITLSLPNNTIMPNLPSNSVTDFDLEFAMSLPINDKEIDNVLNSVTESNTLENVPIHSESIKSTITTTTTLPNQNFQYSNSKSNFIIKKEETLLTQSSNESTKSKAAPLFPPPPPQNQDIPSNYPSNYAPNSQLSYNFQNTPVDNQYLYYNTNFTHSTPPTTTTNYNLPTMSTVWYNNNNNTNPSGTNLPSKPIQTFLKYPQTPQQQQLNSLVHYPTNENPNALMTTHQYSNYHHQQQTIGYNNNNLLLNSVNMQTLQPNNNINTTTNNTTNSNSTYFINNNNNIILNNTNQNNFNYYPI